MLYTIFEIPLEVWEVVKSAGQQPDVEARKTKELARARIVRLQSKGAHARIDRSAIISFFA